MSKLKATHRLSTPIRAKKTIQLQLVTRQAGSGNCIWDPIRDFRRFLRKINWPAASVPAIIQYSTVGFHLMKVSLWATMVAPPNRTITPRLTHCMGSTLPVL